MARTYARIAAVAAVAAGLVLSAGAGAAVADTDSHDGKSTNEHANNGNSGPSGGKDPSGSGGKAGTNSTDKPGGGKSDKPGNSAGSGNGRPTSGSDDNSQNTSSGKDHSASKTQSGTSTSTGAGTTDKPEGDGTGSGTGSGEGSSNGNSGSNGNANAGSDDGDDGGSDTGGTDNGAHNGSSVDDSSSTPAPTETPATAAVDQPTTTPTATTVATATAVPTAGAVVPTPTTAANNDNNAATRAPLAPGGHPSSTVQPGHIPATSLPGGSGKSAADTAAISTRWVSDRTGPGKPADGAVPTSASGWLTKVGNQFIESVATALREVTLKDLALAALPGIAGLIFVFTTGIGLGHRQAKFGFLMETTGSLRFAARGPLGVVRSGGLIAVRARKTAKRGPAGLQAVDRAA